MSKYTAEAIEARVKETGAHWLDHHDCSLCRSTVGYQIVDEEVWFDPACDCSWCPSRPSSFAEIASWIAMQSGDEIRDRILSGFRVERYGPHVAAE